MGGKKLTSSKTLNKSIHKTRTLDRKIKQLKYQLTHEEKEKVIEFMEELLRYGR